MATVTITYNKAGTSPPIFVAGTFSNWQPQEMTCETTSKHGPQFRKTVAVDEDTTEIQYKFRIGGDGDWWALDDNAPTATDAQGNINNVLKITPKITSHASIIDLEQALVSDDDGDDDANDASPMSTSPMFTHECFTANYEDSCSNVDTRGPRASITSASFGTTRLGDLEETIESTDEDERAAERNESSNPNNSVLRQRDVRSPGAQPQSRPGTAASTRFGEENWLKAFLRMIMVDWIGGFMSRLFGRTPA